MRGRLWNLALYLFILGFILNMMGIVSHVVVSAFAKRWFGLPGIKRQSMPDLERWYQRLATRAGFKKYVDLELT